MNQQFSTFDKFFYSVAFIGLIDIFVQASTSGKVKPIVIVLQWWFPK